MHVLPWPDLTGGAGEQELCSWTDRLSHYHQLGQNTSPCILTSLPALECAKLPPAIGKTTYLPAHSLRSPRCFRQLQKQMCALKPPPVVCQVGLELRAGPAVLLHSPSGCNPEPCVSPHITGVNSCVLLRTGLMCSLNIF